MDASRHATAAGADLATKPDRRAPQGWRWRVHRRLSREGFALRTDATAAVYGLVVGSAVIAVDSGKNVPTWETADALIGALIIYWLAETYAHVVTNPERVSNRAWLHLSLRHLRRELPLVTTPLWLVAVMGIARVLGASRNAAVTWALIASVALLGWAGGRGAYRAGRSAGGVAIAATLGAAFGAAAILLKTVVHSAH